jgi:thioredoxin 1
MIELNEENLNEVINKNITMLVFKSEWCGPCRNLTLRINELINEYADDKDVKILKINVDEQPAIATKFGVRNIPNVVFIKNGEVVNRFTGDKQKSEIKNIIDEIKLSKN